MTTNETIQETFGKLDSARGQLAVDFSAVQRIDPREIAALEKLASAADGKAVKIALRGVNIAVYRVLKLVKLAPRFVFE
ncbi:MAG TPA: hypothetical protein VKR61_04040 [Bryobacteraceae bacterium]|nr:hypothetical protein [Bryobacteraceae bacterium]